LDWPNQGNGKSKGSTVLVAVDFSHCSRLALRKAKSWAAMNGGRILALHVIDQDFVRHCIHQYLGTEEEIKKKLKGKRHVKSSGFGYCKRIR
jgi:nucleotide-binding universal stress UspA family protein